MIRLSESRISHLAHLVMDGLRKDKLAESRKELQEAVDELDR